MPESYYYALVVSLVTMNGFFFFFFSIYKVYLKGEALIAVQEQCSGMERTMKGKVEARQMSPPSILCFREKRKRERASPAAFLDH